MNRAFLFLVKSLLCGLRPTEPAINQFKKTFVVHGEEESALAFGERLKQLLPKSEITVPVLHQAIEV